MAVLAGLALSGQITELSKFDRKHYFYPDLPKGYQISQYDKPVMRNGFLEIEVPKGEREAVKVRIHRLHLEEDAAKNLHAGGQTYTDFNRAGCPLAEIVTEPDLRTPREARVFLQELQALVRELGISNADMEKGQMRCDANISLRELDERGNAVSQTLNQKTEIKNLNSFRSVEHALEYEIKRQTKLWLDGTPPLTQTTRGWNDDTGKTIEQREKEGLADYRYFQEPDIPAFDLREIEQNARTLVPELPWEKRARFTSEYGLRSEDARQIVADPDIAAFTEQVFSELSAWLSSEGVEEFDQRKLANLVSGWMLSKLQGELNERGIEWKDSKITPENFAEFIKLVAMRQLNTKSANTVLHQMVESEKDPSQIMEDSMLGGSLDAGEIANAVLNVVNNNPNETKRYKEGKKELLQFFIGMVMKETQGKVDPAMAKNMLLVELEKE